MFHRRGESRRQRKPQICPSDRRPHGMRNSHPFQVQATGMTPGPPSHVKRDTARRRRHHACARMCDRRMSLIIAEKFARLRKAREGNYFAYERQMFRPCPETFPPAQPCLYLARVLRSHPSGLLHSSRIRTRNQALFDPAILLVPPPEAFPEGWSRRIPLSMSKTACGLPLSPPSPVDAAATATRALELSRLQICRTRERNASRSS